jgi:HAMP domain-containing protein
MSAVLIQPSIAAAPTKRRARLGMRWKLVFGFGVAITVVFIVVAGWILRFSTNTAESRLKNSLVQLAEGGAKTIDTDNFSALLALDAAPKPGEVYPSNSGFLAGTTTTSKSTWPTDRSYWQHVAEMRNIRLTNPDASPYTFAYTSDGALRFIGQWGAYGYTNASWCTNDKGEMIDDPCGAAFKQPAKDIYGTIPHFVTDGLQRTTQQPAYKDSLNTWISVYTPIKNTAGKVIGGLGVDYPLSYVNNVRSRVLRVLYPVFGVSYVVLLILIYLLSGLVTRRLGRLTTVTQRVAEGDYGVDVEQSAKALFADEMTELAVSFKVMTQKVGERERTLTQTVAVLRVEIDEVKRKDAVSEIVDSDFFNDLTKKAGAMRAKVKGLELAESMTERNATSGGAE